MLVVNPTGSNNVYYDSIISTDSTNVYIGGNLVPTQSNTYILGASGATWKDIYIGPGSLNIAGPEGFTGVATIGSNLAGIAYSQNGFATPFLNVGPTISTTAPLGTVGGWQIYGTGPTGSTITTDLVAQQIVASGQGLTGPVYSLINSKTGPTGPAGIANASISYISNQGYTGPASSITGYTGYFLDSVNLGITGTSYNKLYLINASCQVLCSGGIKNLAASIFRSSTGMTGYSLPSSYINLANNQQTDVIYSPDIVNFYDLNTSLWSFSVLSTGGNNARVNGYTINMQSYDRGLTGSGPYFYAIRVNTDTASLNYGNIRISSVSFS